ncbi:uncharacterized protein JCM15063_004487 [Sporobolomyces koalae]|uniref:uncharacterized protein n=1 Tax=Sporobolomyces koalae TaxID=500713 RepID=UPI00316FFF0A
MRLSLLLNLLPLVLASPTPAQVPFLGSPSASIVSDLGLPTSLSAALTAQLAELPLDHLVRLQDHVAHWDEPRTVRLRAHDGQPGLDLAVTEGHKALLTLAGIRFVDTTHDIDSAIESDSKPKYPSHLAHNATTVAPYFGTISLPRMTQFLTDFTRFKTRYYRSSTGRESQLFLLNHLKHLHKSLNPKAKVTFTEFDHEWTQKSIIVRWEPTHKGFDDDVVILSAHQDSTNSLPFLPAPGADDDASGTVTLVETFTSLLTHTFAPVSHPVEFHFYSAEEGGLLGSGDIARSYRAQSRSVKSMFHMDVVAYVKPNTEPVIGMITDGTNHDLVEFMKLLVNEYATIPYAETQCGYGCSDFASFTKNGYPSACLAEGKFADSNPFMHSMKDRIDAEGYSLGHIREYIRVSIGYVIELTSGDKSSIEKGKWRME